MSALETISQFFEGRDPFWTTLWILLGVATLVMLVLMITRWGRSEPLNRCIVLSLWMHMLLATYAASVHVIVAPAATISQSAINIDSGEEEGVVEDAADSDRVPLWDRFTPQSLADVEQPELAPAETMEAPEVERKAAEDDVASVATMPSSLQTTQTPLEPPKASPTPTDFTTVQPSAPEAIDVAAAKPRPAPELKTAPVESPAAAPVAPPTPTKSTQPALPDTLMGPPSELARMAEPSTPTLPDVLSAAVDALPRQTSPAPAEPVASSAPSNTPPSNMTVAPTPSVLGAAAAPLPRLVDAPPSTVAIAPPPIYSMRFSRDHTAQAERRGGSPETEAAVKRALAWLAKSQSADGRWDASVYGAGKEPHMLGHDRHGAGAHADTGVTGLALLALLGAGHTHTRGDYQTTVARGLDFLVRSQGPQGQLGGEAEVYAFMYCHGMASLALSEAYAMSGDERLRGPVRNAISYTINAQNRATGGWRYRPGDTGDTSQLGWQLMALKSAELGGIQIPAGTRERMTRFLSSVTSGQSGGLASYRPTERVSRTMTAEALVCRQFLGIADNGRATAEATSFIAGELPGASPTNLYYWYYGTLGMYQAQGEAWERWNSALVPTLVGSQKQDGEQQGSWDPDPVWGPHGGRVYSTALAALCLEVYYRYLPLYVEAAKTDRQLK